MEGKSLEKHVENNKRVVDEMASSEDTWLGDIIHDFIHSSIWLSPIQTFIDTHCASFDIDEDESSSSLTSEEGKIYQKYQNLVESLINGLGDDLNLDKRALKEYYRKKNSITTDESYEQMFSANDILLFKEMMRKRNLILQLQALVHLQLQYGLMKQSDTDDDQILHLLVQATSSRGSSRPQQNSDSDEDLKLVQEHRSDENKTIDSIPEEILREKLHQLSIDTAPPSMTKNDATSNISSRKDFLQKQRDLIIEKQRRQRTRALENETSRNRPQSAAKVARNAMINVRDPSPLSISNDELEKRRAVAAKLRREVIDKR